MKKLLVWLLVLMLVLSVGSAMAEDVEVGQEGQVSQEEADNSEFEQVLLKKGVLLQKEFIDCCLFQEDKYYSNSGSFQALSNTLNLQSASLTDIETGKKIYALRVTGYYYNSQYDNGEAVGVMDADEIDGAISTLEYIKEHIAELKDYSEIEYTGSSGMSIGAYHSDTDNQIFIKINNKATKFYNLSAIDELIAAFTQVKDTFQ